MLGLVSVCGIGDLAGGRPGIHATTKLFAHAGGWLGSAIGGGLVKVIGIAGATVVLLALLLVALIIGTGVGLRALFHATVTSLRFIGSHLAHWWSARERPERDEVEEEEEDETEVVLTRRQRREAQLALEPEPEEYEEEYEEEVDDDGVRGRVRGRGRGNAESGALRRGDGERLGATSVFTVDANEGTQTGPRRDRRTRR